ncbi:hypothetical protein FCH28_07825 [Streptomyces piniterrae]|uniref:ABC transporter permease n=1 Tax=Streptomyces piniterrae TaxID=2571125 RepID=A0A4U0NS32_9ACTN|nr:hypothetical protein [Streptomyces piniterrae]TJZ57327.1 hypothetical protein FCH28_07825 [Streptomyces piniterrae]
MKRGRIRHMLHIGRAAGRTAEGGRARFWALLAATAVVAVTLSSLSATAATWQGREQRGAARVPTLAQHGQQGSALWSRYWDSYQGRQFTVVVIAPLTKDAPLPPGVARWPGPGEVFLSPALAQGPADEDFGHRYGTRVGTISAEGLASPGERLAYVRPTTSMLGTARMEKITGYGGAGAAFGDLRIVGPQSSMLAIIGVLLGLPALGLAAAAARMGAAGRDRRDALLHTLGAGRAARAWMDIGAAIRPACIGAAVAALLTAPFLLVDVQLPWIDYTLYAPDLRRVGVTLAAAIAASMVMMLGLVLLLRPAARTGTSTRPRSAGSGLLRLLALGSCPAFLVLALTSRSFGAQRSAAAYLFAVVGVWMTLPWVIGWAASHISRRASKSPHHSGTPARLIAARTTAARPGMVVRLVAAMIIAIGVIGQTQIITSLLFARSGDEEQLNSAQGRTMALVQTSATRLTDAFTAALPHGAHTVAIGTGNIQPDGSSGSRVLQAPCSSLHALRLPCPAAGQEAEVPYGALDKRLRVTGYQTFGETPAVVRTGPVSAIGSAQGLQAVVFTALDEPMNIPAVKRAAHLYLSVKALTEPVAEDGAKSFTVGYQSRWIPFLGTIGTLVLLTAMALAALSEFLRFSQTLAPLTVLTGRGQVFHTTAFWCLGAPLLGAGAIGTFVHVVLVQPVTGGESGATLSWNLITAVLTVTALLAAAATAAGGATAARRALTWRPRAD